MMRKVVATLALLVAIVPLAKNLAAQSCCEPTTSDFPRVGGDYGNQNYSSLGKINRTNIGQLGAAWHDNLEGGSTDQYQQATAVAVGGVLFVETSQGHVFAVDGKTGAIKWKYDSGTGVQLHRGVAVGGGKVFATLADRQVLWLKQLDEPTIGTLKTAVVYFDGLIYFGSADGPRGAAFALKADTGDIAWKFYGAAAPGEPGGDTWGGGDAWKTGGASPWMHPAIDPELGLVYWAFGN